jgi:RpiB/LacA/LacB family sugar-phosphate isomerase
MIFIGADHRGFNLKQLIKTWLTQNNHQVEDLGAETLDPDDDYPIYAENVAKRVSASDPLNQDLGIVICGSGVGVNIVANKFDKIRSGFGMNVDQVKSGRRDDNTNVLALPADNIDESTAIEMVKAFIETEYEEADRRNRRLEEIKKIEDNQ